MTVHLNVTPARAASVPAYDHVFVIVMENQAYTSIIGNPAAPYVNNLLPSGGLAANYYGVTHPSLPNYLAMVGGSTFGITSDCTACWVSGRNIGDTLEAAGNSWKAYMESMPSACFIGDSYPYVQKHNPFIYFNSIRTNPSRCQTHVVPYSQLATDLQSTATTPNYAFITPNMCNDTHDCPVATGDAWLQQQMSQILESPAFKTQHSLLVLTWDEDDFAGTNRVPLVLQGWSVATGSQSVAAYDHYSLLRTIENARGLPTLTANDAAAVPMADLFAGAAPPPPPPPPPPLSSPIVSYLSWFDNVSTGMENDSIHLLNSGSGTSTGSVSVGSNVVRFSLSAGQQTYLTMPPSTIGGPVVVTVNSGPAIKASQRVQYFQSFNEVWAIPAAQAATTSYLSWFDNASPGMLSDNIHIINTSGVTATGLVSLPGVASLPFTVAAGQAGYVTWPSGVIGGPVTISASQPVLASQRVRYNRSFNEVAARSAARASTTSYFNWFDTASPGMLRDNVHILNPGATSATVTIRLPGAIDLGLTVGPGAFGYVSFPAGNIGGPVTVSSSQPVLASQRVQYYESFNEVDSDTGAQAATTSHSMWFDKASTGMVADSIHLLNPAGTTATVTVSLPGSSPIKVTVAGGAEAFVTFSAGSIGGPVTITSSQPVLASQRVQYYQSFNELRSS